VKVDALVICLRRESGKEKFPRAKILRANRREGRC
jgi:hypothetical protein